MDTGDSASLSAGANLVQTAQCSAIFKEMDFLWFISGVKPDDMEWSDWSDFILDYVETNACVSAIVFLTLTRYE